MSAVTPNRTRSVYSHLEVSVYYALLMAILHRRHNLPSDGLMVEDTGREGRRREERQKQHEPLEAFRDDLAHEVARRCWRATPWEGKRQRIRTSEPKAVMSYKGKKKKKKSHILSRSDFPDVLSHLAGSSPSSVATPQPGVGSAH